MAVASMAVVVLHLSCFSVDAAATIVCVRLPYSPLGGAYTLVLYNNGFLSAIKTKDDEVIAIFINKQEEETTCNENQ